MGDAITILGAGAWGEGLAALGAAAGQRVQVWSRRGALDLAACLGESRIVVSAVAMAGVEGAIAHLATLPLPEDLILVTATKGLDTQTQQTPAQLWQAAFPHYPIVVLSGPNLSKEIAQGLPAATVVASTDFAAATQVQTCLASDHFRVYLNCDPIGTELGGTLKNVMAIAAGVCDGLALGTNAKAALLTRALPEMVRVGVALGAQPETFFGLSGLGDLLATCSSPLSRNYQVGYSLGQGRSLPQILAHLEGTAEGVNTAAVLLNVAKSHKITLPITIAVNQLLQGEITPIAAVEALMARELKAEGENWWS
ncbi:NAD(P)H-dependent glycerol-3-phosphate dehydrogenase [Spirulina sp. CCNP1310]|uniref:NAD(P)H-dependent glycerol-3-phosphate dehydrogenase n=1 Tax=Spirulina sp. CCNP1310 TaxID=3110249 RepID=UPI002B2122C3|nr:NAD(P)H-dependent glycerol-3-phosphate dehydrogenase [Spirulina sp. CCNP1310]MEA5417684.1 NAD(P)H-dependent glycerol-3-phosphate dehydrogenase [Spirulina sp. CCNP1310]